MAGYNVDKIMNFEKRTGIKDGDIDDFLRKVTDVDHAIKGMMAGELDPDDVRVEGIPTKEEEKKTNEKREKALADLKRREEERRIASIKEEKEKWWRGAELLHGHTDDNKESTGASASAEEDKALQRLKDRYSMEYSKWDKWTPSDPVSIEEAKEKEAAEDEIKNAEFEKNNAKFCEEFTEDAKKRREMIEKRQNTSASLRLKGNRYFKAKQYEKALELYMESLKLAAYDTAVLGNVAMAHLKLENWEQAIEFCDRTLYVDPKNTKALSRRATANVALGDKESALKDLMVACDIDLSNKDLIDQFKVLKTDMEDELQEKNALKEIEETSTLKTEVINAPATTIPDSTNITETKKKDVIKDELTKVLPQSKCETPAEISQYINTLAMQVSGSNPTLAKFSGLSLIKAIDLLPKARVYIRVGGGLDALVRAFVDRVNVLVDSTEQTEEISGTPSAQLESSSGELESSEESSSAELISLTAVTGSVLAEVVKGEHKSQVVAWTSGVGTAAETIFGHTSMNNTEIDISIKCSLAMVTERCLSAWEVLALIRKNVIILTGLTSLATVHIEAGDTPRPGYLLPGVLSASRALWECVTGAEGEISRNILAKFEKSVPLEVAGAIENQIQTDVALGSESSILLEVRCGILANLSLSTDLRKQYGEGEGIVVSTLTKVAIDERLDMDARALSLAALVNCCAGDSQSATECRTACHNTGATHALISTLSQSNDSLSKGQVEVTVRLRMLSLLGRLTAHPPALQILSETKTFGVLCDAVRASADRGVTAVYSDPGIASAIEEERGHLVRIFAATLRCVAQNGDESANLARQAVFSGTVSALVSMLPPPKTGYGGVVSSESIALRPAWSPPPSLAGNICGALLQLAVHPEAAEQIVKGSGGTDGLERLLCQFACSGGNTQAEISTRKNCGICLARLAKDPLVRARMDELRGMEMLRESKII